MSHRAAVLIVSALLLALALSCGTEPDRTTPPPAGLQPLNDTPQNAVLRLIAAYEQKKTGEYDAMFTGDFRFEFSTAADPTLAQKYAAGWFAADESTSADHLFRGFTTDYGYPFPGASSIDFTFQLTLPTNDFENPDTARFKMLATRVDGVIVVPPGPGQSADTRFIINMNYHRFSLVRGDAAVGLHAGQPADSSRWYVYRWVDETGQLGAPTRESRTGPQASANTTWGAMKAMCR